MGTANSSAVIIFDVYGRSVAARKAAEEARREALGPESRAEEDLAIFSRLVQVAYTTEESVWTEQVKLNFTHRHGLLGSDFGRENVHSAIAMLRFKRRVMLLSKEDLRKYGVTI